MRFTHLLALSVLAGAVSTIVSTTASAQSAATIYRMDGEQPGHRAALGVGTSSTGTLRDTLGILVTSITRGSPAEKAGLEEGNRLAAINGVSLRAAAADVEDGEMAGTFTRRLTRELAKVKAGDEVELRVYRDGRTQSIRVKTADADTLFRRTASTYTRTSREEMDNRPALGFGIGSSGSRRDTLGVLIMSVPDSTPAARAGLEEGNRVAAINGVSLRVAREDAGDGSLGSIKANRLQREISQLKPGETVTLRVYSGGQFRDVTMKVARAGDMPRRSGFTLFGEGMGMMMPSTAPMPPMSPMAPMVPRMRMGEPMPTMPSMPMEPVRVQVNPEFRRSIEALRGQALRLQPQIQRELERIRPELQMQLRRMQPELDRARGEVERLRIEAPRRIRMVNVIV